MRKKRKEENEKMNCWNNKYQSRIQNEISKKFTNKHKNEHKMQLLGWLARQLPIRRKHRRRKIGEREKTACERKAKSGQSQMNEN